MTGKDPPGVGGMQIPGQGFLASPLPHPCNFPGLRRSYMAATVMSHEVGFLLPLGIILLFCFVFLFLTLKQCYITGSGKRSLYFFFFALLFSFNNDAIARNTLKSNLWEIKMC